MTRIKKSTKVLALVVMIMLITLSAIIFMAFGEDVHADAVEGDKVAEIDETVEEDSWFSQNWKTIVEILTSSTAVAVILAILKLVGKLASVRKDLGVTNTDNKALKGAFNEMADKVEFLEKQIATLSSQIAIMLKSVQDGEKKSAAVLAILERLISSSDLPTETKTALQREINKADEKAEDVTNDEE